MAEYKKSFVGKAIFAAGCFWGVQKKFDSLNGVIKTTVGYIGGRTENPTYEQVCSHTTGHAEAIFLEYDKRILSYSKLLEFFFSMHDPTQINRQGPDIGDNYRSAIFYLSNAQKIQAENMVAKLDSSGIFGKKKIATTIEKAGNFYPAEDYHQKYYLKNRIFGCHLN